MRRIMVFALLLALAGLLSSCELVAERALANFSLQLSPAELTVAAGSQGEEHVKVNWTVDILPTAVDISLENAPDGVTAEDITTDDEADMTLEVASTVPPGSYKLTVKGTNSSALPPVSKTATFTLKVTP